MPETITPTPAMHWRPTADGGYVLSGFPGKAELRRTTTARGRVVWTLATDAGAHDLGRKAEFGHAEALLGL